MSEIKNGVLTFTRNTLTGSEWWDSANKKTVFEDLQFHVEDQTHVLENAEKAIPEFTEKQKQEIEELGLPRKEKPGNTGTAKLLKENEEDPKESKGVFSEMTIRELKDYAKAKQIAIPKDITSKKDVAAFLETEKELRDQ